MIRCARRTVFKGVLDLNVLKICPVRDDRKLTLSPSMQNMLLGSTAMVVRSHRNQAGSTTLTVCGTPYCSTIVLCVDNARAVRRHALLGGVAHADARQQAYLQDYTGALALFYPSAPPVRLQQSICVDARPPPEKSL